MLNAAYLIPVFPLFGALTLLFVGRRIGEPRAGWVGTAMAGGSFIAACVTFIGLMNEHAHERQVTKKVFEWIHIGDLHVDAAFLIDPLSMTMVLFITGISTLIHLYSIEYMHGDPRFSRFFLYLNSFVFSMLMLVLGDNLVLTFLGWEGVGACSYLLISFWFERDSASVAGKKAFITNRIGDVGFMIAMFFIFNATKSLTYVEVFEHIAEHPLASTTVTAIVCMLLVGACGKSAQLPLFVWLPDAMEGPTPVSALIHAATMVTAGVYLLVRCSPLLNEAPGAMTLIAIVGAGTALVAATIAVAQNDIKKVLAYSTVSQLGYMFLAVGSGAYVAAIFHMVTHAFFKALLFLGSGSVIHGLGGEQDMKRMGALKKFMPVTAATFLIGWLAIAGVPPFAGFWSKDEILLAAWEKSPILWFVGLVTALLTAYYMTRQIVLVFFGKRRDNQPAAAQVSKATSSAAHDARDAHDAHDAHAQHDPHESKWPMLTPLVILAGLSIIGGVINLPLKSSTLFLEHWLEPVLEGHASHSSTTDLVHAVHESPSTSLKIILAAIAIVVSLAGVIGGLRLWANTSQRDELEPEFFKRAWRIDETYAWLVGKPGAASAQFMADVDSQVVDGAVLTSARGVRGLAQLLRYPQTGFVRLYAGGMVLATVAIFGVVMIWAR